MKTIILTLLFMYLLYKFFFGRGLPPWIESQSYQSQTEFTPQQTGGASIINRNTENSNIFQDREEYFKYEKGDYPYLNKINQHYQKSLSSIEKKKQKISSFIDEYQRTKELLEDKMNINTLYTPADIKRKEREAEELREIYNRHLNMFLELASLNNQLIVYELYSNKNSNKSTNKKRVILDTYYQKMKDFLATHHKLIQTD